MSGSHNQNPGSSTQEEVGERGVRTCQLWKKTDSNICGANVVKNIARLQNAAQSTSHWLSRRQVVLTKRLLPEIELSEFEFLSFVTIWVWVLSQFEYLAFVTIWIFKYCCYLSFWVLMLFELSKIDFWVVTIWVFAIVTNLIFFSFVSISFFF